MREMEERNLYRSYPGPLGGGTNHNALQIMMSSPRMADDEFQALACRNLPSLRVKLGKEASP
jgi:hypothetical protein